MVFDRAYTHSPQSLPAHASLLTGRLPIDHGVRDDAGFSLAEDTNTLAELLRNRGFATGAAVSSFLLQARTGLSQGFAFFDDEMPTGPSEEIAAVERGGSQTIDVAERWMAGQSGQRFFLFVQVPGRDADAAVMRLTCALKQHGIFDGATILVVGDRGDVGSGMTLDDRALRVPFIVKLISVVHDRSGEMSRTGASLSQSMVSGIPASGEMYCTCVPARLNCSSSIPRSGEISLTWVRLR